MLSTAISVARDISFNRISIQSMTSSVASLVDDVSDLLKDDDLDVLLDLAVLEDFFLDEEELAFDPLLPTLNFPVPLEKAVPSECDPSYASFP